MGESVITPMAREVLQISPSESITWRVDLFLDGRVLSGRQGVVNLVCREVEQSNECTCK